MMLMMSDAENNQPFIPIKEMSVDHEETAHSPPNNQRSSLNASHILEPKPRKTARLEVSEK